MRWRYTLEHLEAPHGRIGQVREECAEASIGKLRMRAQRDRRKTRENGVLTKRGRVSKGRVMTKM